jgi:hypothetical protein
VLGEHGVAFVICLGVDMTRLVEDIITQITLILLGPFFFLALALLLALTGQGRCLGFICCLGLAFLLFAGVAARLIGLFGLAFAISQPLCFFTVRVLQGYFHHSAEGQDLSPDEVQDQLSVPNACLEGADRLVFCHILHRLVRSGPSLARSSPDPAGSNHSVSYHHRTSICRHRAGTRMRYPSERAMAYGNHLDITGANAVCNRGPCTGPSAVEATISAS